MDRLPGDVSGIQQVPYGAHYVPGGAGASQREHGAHLFKVRFIPGREDAPRRDGVDPKVRSRCLGQQRRFFGQGRFPQQVRHPAAVAGISPGVSDVHHHTLSSLSLQPVKKRLGKQYRTGSMNIQHSPDIRFGHFPEATRTELRSADHNPIQFPEPGDRLGEHLIHRLGTGKICVHHPNLARKTGGNRLRFHLVGVPRHHDVRPIGEERFTDGEPNSMGSSSHHIALFRIHWFHSITDWAKIRLPAPLMRDILNA